MIQLFQMFLKHFRYMKHVDLISLEYRFQFSITHNLSFILWILEILAVIRHSHSYMLLDVVPNGFCILVTYPHLTSILQLDYMNLYP